MSFATAQIKDMLREILVIVKDIKAQLEIPVMNVLDVEDIPESKPNAVVRVSTDISKTATEAAKAEKRRIFLERMRVGREKAAEKRSQS